MGVGARSEFARLPTTLPFTRREFRRFPTMMPPCTRGEFARFHLIERR